MDSPSWSDPALDRAPFSDQLVVVRPRIVSRIVAVVVLLACLGTLVYPFWSDAPLEEWQEPLLLIALVALVVTPLIAWRRWTRRDVVPVIVDASSLRVDEAREISRDRIRSVQVRTRAERVAVVVSPRFPGRAEVFEFGNLGPARPLVLALGYDVSQRSTDLALPSPLNGSPWSGLLVVVLGLFVTPLPFTMIAGAILSAFGPGTAGVLAMILAPVCGWALAIWLTVHRRVLTVGADGFAWRWFGVGGAVAFPEIAGTRVDVSTVVFRSRGGSTPVSVARLVVTLRSGAKVELPVARGTDAGPTRTAAEDVLTWLRIAWDVGAKAPHEDASFPVPTVEGSPAAWLSQARTPYAGLDAGSEGAAKRELLWRTLEDPRAPWKRRAAAAALVGSTLAAWESERMARVALATAHPALRGVLEAAARSDDARIAAALARVQRA